MISFDKYLYCIRVVDFPIVYGFLVVIVQCLIPISVDTEVNFVHAGRGGTRVFEVHVCTESIHVLDARVFGDGVRHGDVRPGGGSLVVRVVGLQVLEGDHFHHLAVALLVFDFVDVVAVVVHLVCFLFEHVLNPHF